MKGEQKNSDRNYLKILFVGDFCPINRAEKLSLIGKEDTIFGDTLVQLHDKDLSVVNLECPLTEMNSPKHKVGPNLKANPKTVACLKAGSFDIANLANNHIADYGSVAINQTIRLLKSNRIETVGAGSDLFAAKKPLRIKSKGRVIEFLAFAENELGCADENIAGACPLNPVSNISQIIKAKNESDIVIVLIHGGNEFNPVPSPRVVRTFRTYVDAGASVVIGTHPHVPQGYEIHRGSPIFYSLGNFIFDKAPENVRIPLWSKSYFVRLHFKKNNAQKIETIPYKTLLETGCLKLLKGKELNEFREYTKFLSEILKDNDKIMTYWNAWCALRGPKILRRQSLSFPITFLYSILPQKIFSQNKHFLEARNLIRCEAHHELLYTFMDLAIEKRIHTARKYIPAVKALKKGMLPQI